MVEIRCPCTVLVGTHKENKPLGMLILVISIVENHAVYLCQQFNGICLRLLSDILFLRNSLIGLAHVKLLIRQVKYLLLCVELNISARDIFYRWKSRNTRTFWKVPLIYMSTKFLAEKDKCNKARCFFRSPTLSSEPCIHECL